MKPRISTVFILSLILLFSACQDDEYSSPPADVYVFGSVNNLIVNDCAAYWKNGEEKLLSTASSFSYVNDVAKKGDEIHMVGSERNSGESSRAVHWINDQANFISEATEAISIKMEGDDEYILLLDRPQGTIGFIKIMINSEISTVLGISNAGYRAMEIKDFEVQDGNLFILADAKKQDYSWTPVVIENGQITELTYGTQDCRGTAIYVHNNNVYVSGYHGYDDAIYWKNDSPTKLPGAAKAKDILFHNGDVHVVGYREGAICDYQALHWVNDISRAGTPDVSQFLSIASLGDDLYFMGYDGLCDPENDVEVTVVYKNDERHELPPTENAYQEPKGIFVFPK